MHLFPTSSYLVSTCFNSKLGKDGNNDNRSSKFRKDNRKRITHSVHVEKNWLTLRTTFLLLHNSHQTTHGSIPPFYYISPNQVTNRKKIAQMNMLKFHLFGWISSYFTRPGFGSLKYWTIFWTLLEEESADPTFWEVRRLRSHVRILPRILTCITGDPFNY